MFLAGGDDGNEPGLVPVVHAASSGYTEEVSGGDRSG